MVVMTANRSRNLVRLQHLLSWIWRSKPGCGESSRLVRFKQNTSWSKMITELIESRG